MKNRLALSVTFGFAVGCIVGLIIGISQGDIALWLAVGNGAGLAFGAGIGAYLSRDSSS